MPLSVTAISANPDRAGRPPRCGSRPAVGDRVGQQVGHRGAQLALHPADDEAALAADGDLELLGAGRGAGAVDGLGDHRVDVDRHQLGQRLAALQPGEVDQLAHQPGQPVGLVRDPAGEALHRLRVVGGLLDRLGQQGQRADRRLQLVPHVGDEVAADRLGAPGLGDVLEHQRDRAGRRAACRCRSRTPCTPTSRGPDPPGRPAAATSTRRLPPARTRCASSSSSATSSRLPRTMPSARAAGLASSTASSAPTMTTAGSIRSRSRRASGAPRAAGDRRPGVRPRRGRRARIAETARAADRPAEEEADHQGGQGTHASMLGRPAAGSASTEAVVPVRGSVHLRVAGRSPPAAHVRYAVLRSRHAERPFIPMARPHDEGTTCGRATARNWTTSGTAWWRWQLRGLADEHRHHGPAGRRRRARRPGDRRRRADRRHPREHRAALLHRCWPASSRSPPTCARSSRPCGSPVTSSGWATSPSTSPSSRACASPSTRCRRRSARRSSRPATWPRCS